MPRDTGGSGGLIGATERSFDIIERLADTPEGAEISVLAAEMDVAKSTVYNHLQTLRELGYVVKREDRYALGLQFLTLGDRARRRYPLYHYAKRETDSLVEAVGERAQVMVEENGHGVYIYQTKADGAVQTDSHTGTVVSLHATAVGKAYLAFLPEDERNRLLGDAVLESETPNTVTDRERLLADLQSVRERGYAVNDEEKTMGMRAIGAPIQSDDTETVLGAISVSGPTTRMNGEWFRKEVPEMVRQAAQVIGIRATYS
jgi:DNA-binding IclR family transcriptional regulator